MIHFKPRNSFAGFSLILLLQTSFFISGFSQSTEREVFSSAGGEFINTYQISWTIGESITETFPGGNELTQGFQQGAIPEVLPVELISFSAKRIDVETVDLKWETASEINIKTYLVQRKHLNEPKFQDVARISSENQLDAFRYETIDSNNFRGISFYRLKILEFDGALEYSEVRPVEGWQDSNSATAFPNPIGGDFQLNFNEGFDLKSKIDLKIFDPIGREIFRKDQFFAEAEMNFEFLKNVPPGNYFLHIKSNSGFSQILKITKI